MLGVRPHIRPLLLARQRCPAYQVAVVDRRRLWLFAVDGNEVESAWVPVGRHDYDPAAHLTCLVSGGSPGPLVVGGPDADIERLLGSAPAAFREAVMGRFTVDPRTLTAAGVRDLAAPVVARWADLRARQLAAGILAMPLSGHCAVGLADCLAAVSAGVAPGREA